MAKNLKLTGIKSYINPHMDRHVKQGEVVKFDDKIAKQIKRGTRRNGEGEEIPYWTDAAADATADVDMTVAAVARRKAGEDEEEDMADEPAAETGTPGTVAAAGQRLAGRRSTVTK